MLALYVVCRSLQGRFGWLGYPAAFAEAGMVGACADWFAVTALFRRPLGLPIPHTAILPRNQRRLADQLGAFIASNFLAPAEITPRLERLDIAGWIAAWLRDPSNIEIIVECARALLPPAQELASDGALRRFGQDLIREGIDQTPAAPMAARALSSAMKLGYHRGIYDRGLAWAIGFLTENRAAIRAKAGERRWGWLPRWVDAWAADSFIAGLVGTLEAAQAPDHAWRGEYEALLARMAERLAHDRDTYDMAEQLKADVLDAQVVESCVAWLSGRAEARLAEEIETGDGVVTRALRRGLGGVGAWLEKDARVRDTINRWARDVVLGAVVPNRAEIGGFVADVVARWDAATLVERLETYVGKDLQYIRINGTLVGGLVGLALFALTRLFGG